MGYTVKEIHDFLMIYIGVGGSLNYMYDQICNHLFVPITLMFREFGMSHWVPNCMEYRYCSEGCCVHEYCAYHSICYPKIHCEFSCPDGLCVNEICMPYKKCNSSQQCGMANVCTYHHNLGYDTCQYDLDIGKSLCLDRDGKSALKVEN
ncbi:hypothetical protein LOTGIDRAFT_174113 [Lottia gigantea]|uniref:Uncharacterized protein n=1 Tax=Lottia gigantea TaxID=225164 RepID=V4A400_LOTGI|nr:hypothetical protein LOTGIDRAFT_174113 [Lottia gigantea]ESO98638.1 hypothetical protein LOTGIDRAFT_174113 [Lottia gigantea]